MLGEPVKVLVFCFKVFKVPIFIPLSDGGFNYISRIENKRGITKPNSNTQLRNRVRTWTRIVKGKVGAKHKDGSEKCYTSYC